jgi:uncharacterized protein YcbX
MFVQALWRYPVKSMAGERLEHAELRPDGIAGDRLVHVKGMLRGRIDFITARTHPRLLGLRGGTAPDGTPLIDGRRWDAPEALAAVRAAVAPDAQLVYDEGLDRFDVLPLLVATDGAVAAFGEDGRRLRPNIVVGGVDGLAEREWPGKRLRIGTAVVGIESRRGRCVMTTYHPDTLEQDAGVLRRIVREFGGKLALDAWVVTPGTIRIGDPAALE